MRQITRTWLAVTILLVLAAACLVGWILAVQRGQALRAADRTVPEGPAVEERVAAPPAPSPLVDPDRPPPAVEDRPPPEPQDEALILALQAADLAFHDQPEWKPRIKDALQQQVTFQFADTSIDAVIRFLQELTQVSFVLDPQAVADKPRITLTMNDVSLAAALDHIAEMLGLVQGHRSEAIWLTTPERAKAYEQRKLAEVHRKFARTPDGQPVEPPEEPWKEKLRTAVQQKVTFQFADTAIDAVARFFGELTGVTFVVDPEALVGKENTRVTLSMTDVNLESALDYLTDQLGLTYGLRDEAFWITTPERLDAYEKRTAGR